MRVVSNLLHGRDRSAVASIPHPSGRDQVQDALRLLLGKGGRRAANRDVMQFLRQAVQRRIDFGGLWIIESGDAISSAVLALPSPGRTMMILAPAAPPDSPATAGLIDAVCTHYANQNLLLAQALIDPGDQLLQTSFSQAGFQHLADLEYLARPVPRHLGEFVLPPPLRAVEYSQDDHGRFQATILASYEASRDCPALTGRRDIDDILAGHRAVGEFDPKLWMLLLEGDRPVGVCLLNRLHNSTTCELVYLGLPPASRGRGLGDVLMQQTLATLARAKMDELTLAVDAANAPALALYQRHGLYRIDRKRVMLRALHKPAGG